MEVGFAVIPAVGAPPLPLTVTVTWPQSVAPDALVAVKRYLVVAGGETTRDPFTGTGVPFRFPLTSFVDVPVRPEPPPNPPEPRFPPTPPLTPPPPPPTPPHTPTPHLP